ncbi:MAG: (2Fe-2S)-binding protein [Chloroflexi bacterium]|nr:(2Fe-2S)-binding protein [Chloroflexota bacterium]
MRVKSILRCTVNGEDVETLVDSRSTLLDFLRETLGLTGTKEGCGNGNCGCCTVLLEGQPVDSCLVFAVEVEGRTLTTIEGLARGKDLDPLQVALNEHGGTQCGFCTPGVILSAKALLDRNPSPTEPEIRLAIAGNLCRCTGYDKIVRAIAAVAAEGRASVVRPSSFVRKGEQRGHH